MNLFTTLLIQLATILWLTTKSNLATSNLIWHETLFDSGNNIYVTAYRPTFQGCYWIRFTMKTSIPLQDY